MAFSECLGQVSFAPGNPGMSTTGGISAAQKTGLGHFLSHRPPLCRDPGRVVIGKHFGRRKWVRCLLTKKSKCATSATQGSKRTYRGPAAGDVSAVSRTQRTL